MKTTKRVIAVVLAAMMLALMIPFAASAVDFYSVNVTGKANYKFTVYQIATLNNDGSYNTVATDAAIVAAMDDVKATNESGENTENALYIACENAAASALGPVAQAETTWTTATATFTTDTAGVYYVRITGKPDGVESTATGGSVFMVGGNSTTTDVNISSKIKDNAPGITKTVDREFAHTIDETVTFTLKATVIGSATEPVTEYIIVDEMGKNGDKQVFSDVKITDVSLYKDKTKGDAIAVTSGYVANTSNLQNITIQLTDAYLNDAKAGNNNFYNSTDVVVTMTAKLTADAIKGVAGNPNTDKLTYKNKFNPTGKTVPGPTVKVYTFDLPVVKTDANTGAAITASPATFTLTDKNSGVKKTTGVVKQTGANGKVTFEGLRPGTYEVVETIAPDGYNVNKTVYTVVIANDGKITVNGTTATEVTVPDTPVLMPATGGQGTMMFTIIGASLIACAGVLFVILKKKRSSK